MQIGKVNKQKLPISDTTMSAYQTFETVLNTIKASNLNFHLQQTPFSAVVYIKNSLIKDKLGNQLVPPSLEDNTKLSIKLLELENMVSSMKNKLEDSFLDSENAHKTMKINFVLLKKL